MAVLVAPFAHVSSTRLRSGGTSAGDRRRLYSVFVAPLHSLRPRLVGLDGGAASAELLRLPARVLELGARVGVDELAGLDPLDAVSF